MLDLKKPQAPDKAIKRLMRDWIKASPEPATFVLFTNDNGYLNLVNHMINVKGFEVLVVYEPDSVPEELIQAVQHRSCLMASVVSYGQA